MGSDQPDFELGCASEEAQRQCEEIDGPQFWRILRMLRKNPFPGVGRNIRSIPGPIDNAFFAWDENAGLVCRVAYLVMVPHNVVITAASLKQLPPYR